MIARLLPKSLVWRAILLSTFWATLSLVVIASVITALYRSAAERNLQSVQSAHLFNLIAAVGADKSGKLNGRPDLGDLRYSEPLSGWYWSVEPVTPTMSGFVTSPSMGERTVDVPSATKYPFDNDYRRRYRTIGLDGETVEVFESEVALAGDNRVARYRVMANRNEFEAEIADFSWSLYRYLIIFGLGSIAVNAMAIMAGLHPLRRAIGALAAIREGKAQHLDGEFPLEIEPLANEMNALIDNNRRIVERSRTQVGNLAHSLKTPLSVIINEGQALGGGKGKLIGEQASAMQTQIQHYLQRARVAAQRDSVVFRAPVAPIIERMLRVMTKLNEQMTFTQEGQSKSVVFAGEAEDFEEILGNLMENAAKWGRNRVEVHTVADGHKFTVSIGDDGPGLTPDQMNEAIKRGKRLDETKPGTGLGLSIVSDTVREYGGELKLGKSALGGLEVSVTLPQAMK